MKVILLLSLLGASQIAAEHLFLPKHTNLREVKLEVPGYIIEKDSLVSLAQRDPSASQKAFTDTEPRGRLGLRISATAGAAAGSSGSPTAVAFQGNQAFTAAAPLCLACTCAVGGKTCAELGGIVVYSAGEPAFGDDSLVNCPIDSPCAIPAPATMSACDPRCKKSTISCNPLTGPFDCVGFGEAVCGTGCENRSPGDKVVCNQRDIATGVMNDVPREICSSTGVGKRSARGLNPRQERLLGQSFSARLTTGPIRSPSLPGSSVFISYAPRGRCIPAQIANAPYCNQL